MRGHHIPGQAKDDYHYQKEDAGKRAQQATSQHCGRWTLVPPVIRNVATDIYDSKKSHDLNIKWRG